MQLCHATYRVEYQRIRQYCLRSMEDSLEQSRRIENQRIRQQNIHVREDSSDKATRMSKDRHQHQVRHRQNVQAAVQNNIKIVCVDDTSNFNEKEYPHTLASHELPSLFSAGNMCPFCHAYRCREERPGFCCEKGHVKLEDLPEPPGEIRQLYSNRAFLNNLRSYNNAMAVASIACEESMVDGFNPTFKIHGKVYHRIGSLLPNQQLSADVLQTLQQCIHSINPYVSSMKTIIEYSTSHPEVKMIINAEKRPTGEHLRRYNLPSSSEVAVIMSGEQISNRDVVLNARNGVLQRITEVHRSYDPLHYVILFPYGTNGYSLDVPHNHGQGNVTPVEFYRYRVQVRNVDRTFNKLMRSRRLLQ